ncbi:MAG: sensor histidine kinase [Acetobacteraceae bacterium]
MTAAKTPELPASGTRDRRTLPTRLAALGTIAADAAHRLNNLRAVIEGTLELIAADPAGPRLAQRLERIREAALRTQAFAEGLIAVAHASPGADERRIDLGAWLSAARPWLLELLGEGGKLAIEIPARTVWFRCDPGQLRLALTALVLNAAAALGPAGTVCIRVESQPVEARAGVLLSVADDGTGMPPEVAARAREPFFTTRPGAAGLGLTTAEAFANRNGGRLGLASSPGRGTTVSLFLVEDSRAA